MLKRFLTLCVASVSLLLTAPAAVQAKPDKAATVKVKKSSKSKVPAKPFSKDPAVKAALPLASSGVPLRVRSVEGITEYKLANGLQVLLIPDDSKPTTTVNLTYRVGSKHENYGETGMAHLLEHLIFKGTPKITHPWAEFMKRGLRANGTTWLDRTNYFASFAANEENLKWYLDWQADAMVNSFIARRDLDTEMTVVRNEMEMGENNPGRMMFERALATMYQWHNYGKSTIGARSDVENVNITRLQAFYRTYYQPDNATLIISGKFDADKTLAWVNNGFGKLPRPQRMLPPIYTMDPVQDGEKSVTLRRNGGSPGVWAAYHVVAAAHPDYAAVDLLNLIMGDTPSGRLHKQLVEKQLAAGAFAFSAELADPGFQMFGLQLAPEQNLDKARQALLAVLESVATEPISQEELERARVKWLKKWDQAFSNPETVGVALSDMIGSGDWRLFFLNRDRVAKITLSEVQRVAVERFRQDNRTLVTYIPTEKAQRAPAPLKVDVEAELKDFVPKSAAAQVEVFDATPAHIESRTERFTLPSGLKVALLAKGSRGGMVRAQLSLHYGDEHSLKNQALASEAAAQMLTRGTAQMSRQQIQDRLDALKAELQVGGGSGSLSINVMTTRENLPATIELAAELLKQASFPEQGFEEWRREALAALEDQRKEPEAVVADAVGRLFNPYPKGDVRYASTFEEQEADIKALKVEQVRAFYRKFAGASHAEFAAVGDLDAAAVRKALEAGLGGWSSTQAFTRVPDPLVAPKPQRLEFKTPDKQNATLLARLSLPLNDRDADYPSLMLANYIFGSGGSSRLWKRIRESEGLSYDVRSSIQWSNFEANSAWVSSAIFAPQNRDKVERAWREELARALQDGFSAKELDEARQGLLNYRKLSRAQDGSLAAALAGNLYLGRNFLVAQKVDEALAKATLEEVNAAFRRHIKPEQLVIAFGGDFKP
jgi:zinc protease